MFPLDEERVLSIKPDAEHLRSAENSENPLGFMLQPGEKNHGKRQLYMELYLSHEYKYFWILEYHKFRPCTQLRILGYGDVPKYISGKARIKLTLGPRVVSETQHGYFLENISLCRFSTVGPTPNS
ncbi:hypothetical protein PHMEG_00027920 [Phytophthora megakarya]|uniref:Uncharacterized protein n=1 Tax=Phytophthora megakarya TaxID=4795 RepID=A0A225V684_9STRA|nr:hypothetical protein PHMEG_00027920 [Phytophthora megakarya]